MNTVPDRRRGIGRRSSDQQSSLALRGLLHDLGHDLATLAYLVEGVRGDIGLSAGTRHRVELIEQETARLLELVREGMWNGTEPQVVASRALLNQIVILASARSMTSVTLRPGEQVSLAVDGTLLWRMVANLVENAVRAAGTDGHVEVSVERVVDDGGAAIVEVADDGPGFGAGPAGWASLGLDVVSGLAAVCGGRMEIEAAHPTGSRVRLLFPDAPKANGSVRPIREEHSDDRSRSG